MCAVGAKMVGKMGGNMGGKTFTPLLLLFTLHLLFGITASGDFLVYDPPKIFPNESEIVITSGNNLTLQCYAKRPVQWITPNNANVDDLKAANYEINVYHTPEDEYPYGIRIDLVDMTVVDVGYYTCQFNDTDDYDTSTEDTVTVGNGRRIYVFVDDPERIMVPTDTVITGRSDDSVIIPCRPSAPNVNVILLRHDVQIVPDKPSEILRGRAIGYDRRAGFIMHDINQEDTAYIYNCTFSRDGTYMMEYFNLVTMRMFHIYRISIGRFNQNMYYGFLNLLSYMAIFHKNISVITSTK